MGRTAQDFDTYANMDLRRYLKRFVLPEPSLSSIPFSHLNRDHDHYGESHENDYLSVQHKKSRILEVISSFEMAKRPVKEWLDLHIPVKPRFLTNPKEDEQYNIPTLSEDFWAEVPSDINEMEVWLCLPLVTATRVLHSTYHDAQCSSFIRPAADDHDNSLFRYVAWATNEQDEREENVSLIVAYQTPYTLTHQDLKEFVSCKNYPNFDAHSKDKLPAKYRLWGKVWDTCKARQCDYFVLTNYSHWVFGFLSKERTGAFVSDILGCKRTPTILEVLTYWLASSLEVEGTLKRPKIYEPIRHADANMEEITQQRVPRAPRFDYTWPGQYEEPGQAAIDDLGSLLSGTESLKSVPSDPNVMNFHVQQWLARCRTANHKKLDEDDLYAPPMVEYELERLSGFTPNRPVGQWMVVS